MTKYSAWAATLIAVLLSAGETLVADDRPNIVVVFTDDHGYSDLSCQGVFPDVRTPNIDALAETGVRMTSGYVTAPQCVPSRGGILSGQYQTKLGLESNTQGKEVGGLDGFNNAKTIAERLQDAGYATGMAGKWHLGPSQEIVDHGFDKVFYRNSGRPGMANFRLDGTDQPFGVEDSGMYHLDACSQAACAFVDRFHDQPFFFYLAYRAPHVPLDATPKYLARFPGEMPERRRQALAMLSAVDDGVGQVVETLRKHDIEKNTLIFVIGDNGAPLKIRKLDAPGGGPGWDGSLNEPLNGEKGMLTEGGVRTPFVVNWKGTIPGGQIYDEPVISLDVAATANALAGLDDDTDLDGVNLVPYLTGEATGAPHKSLYWRWVGQAAIRHGKWKYLTWGGREYLFDVNADIEETNNLIDEHRAVSESLRKDWDQWSEQQNPPGLQVSNSAAAKAYFDWYLDGGRDLPADDSKSLGAAKVMDSKTVQRKKPIDKTAKRRSISPAELFQRRDLDGSKTVTLEEFLANRKGDAVKILTKRFRSFDSNGNGLWDADEVDE